MKRFLFAALPASLFLGLTGTGLSAETGAVPTAEEFNNVQRYNIVYDVPRDLIIFYLRQSGFSEIGADFETFKDPRDSNRRVVIVTVEPIANEQVKGMQWRFGIESEAMLWEAVEAGVRRKCQTGPNSEKWTRDVCP